MSDRRPGAPGGGSGDPTRAVLFVCTENAGRSLMAEAFFNDDPPPGWTADSAGSRPAARPNPRTAPMLAEVGVVAPSHPPQALTPERLATASLWITMGCEAGACPVPPPGVEVRDWALDDPARLDDAGFRRVRDEVRARVGELRRELGGSRPAGRG